MDIPALEPILAELRKMNDQLTTLIKAVIDSAAQEQKPQPQAKKKGA